MAVTLDSPKAKKHVKLAGFSSGSLSGSIDHLEVGRCSATVGAIVAPPTTRFERALHCFSLWVGSSCVEVAILVCVCIDIVVLVSGVHLNGFDHKRLQWTSICHGYLLVFFSFEASVRVLSELAYVSLISKQAVEPLMQVKPSSSSVISKQAVEPVMRRIRHVLSTFVFWDTFLVILAVVGACGWGLHSCATVMPSMIRICRVSRLKSPLSHCFVLRPLQLLYSTIGDSASVLFFSVCLLLLNMLFFSVVSMGLLKPEIEEHLWQDAVDQFGSQTVENCLSAFSSLLSSMSTLLALSTGDEWHEIALPIIFFRPWAFALFFLHTFIASGVVIGLVYGALAQSIHHFCRHANLDEISLLNDRKAVMEELNNIFEGIDADGSGYLTWQEFHHNRKHNTRFINIVEQLGLDDSEILIMWDIMDTSRDGRVSRDEFIKFMWKILFDGGTWAQLKTMHCSVQAQSRSDEVSKHVRQLQDDMLASRRMLEQILIHATAGASALERKHTTESENVDKPKKPENGSKDQEQPKIDVMRSYARSNLASELMRSVDAKQVTRYCDDNVLEFWGGGSFIDKSFDNEYNMSQPCHRCDYFISHCWTAPEGWCDHFKAKNALGKLESYEYAKALELDNVLSGSRRLQFRGSMEHRSSGYTKLYSIVGTTVWIDKCCIPQRDKKTKTACVALLEEFMNLSNGLIVILSWQYFTRLWCVYEWACFLRTHNAALVELGFDYFLKSSPDDTLPLYLESIENLSVKTAQCAFPQDHEILEAKVFQYYLGETPEDSFEAFEHFAKCTAICLMAKQLVLWRARVSDSDETAWLGPFRRLADKLNYHKLGEVLRRAQPARWFAQCGRRQEQFDQIVMQWFENDCLEYLAEERRRAVRNLPKRLDLQDEGQRLGTLDECVQGLGSTVESFRQSYKSAATRQASSSSGREGDYLYLSQASGLSTSPDLHTRLSCGTCEEDGPVTSWQLSSTIWEEDREERVFELDTESMQIESTRCDIEHPLHSLRPPSTPQGDRV